MNYTPGELPKPGENQINFVAPFPAKECAQRLKRFAHRRPRLIVGTGIRLKSFKNGNYHFRITRSVYELPMQRRFRSYGIVQVGRSNYVKIQVEGYLITWADSESTLVIAQSRINPKTYLINGILLLLFALTMLVLSVALLADFLYCAPIIVMMLFSFTYVTLFQPEALAERHKRNLIKEIKQALQEQL